MLKFLQYSLFILIVNTIYGAEKTTPAIPAANQKLTNKVSTESYQPLASQLSASVATHYKEDVVTWISKDEGTFFVKSGNKHKLTYGNILYIADWGDNPLSIGNEQRFIHQLNNLGWNIFSLYSPMIKSSGKIENDSNNSTLDSTNEFRNEIYKQQANGIQKSIQRIYELSNDELFVVVEGHSAQSVINLIIESNISVVGFIFILPNLTSFSDAHQQKLFNHKIPRLIFWRPHSNELEQKWNTLERRSPIKESRVIKYDGLSFTSSLSQFNVNRIHGWLKMLTIKNPN